MEENLRRHDAPESIRMTAVAHKLVKECKRQEESCLYTSTALYIWLREARRWRAALIVTPIVFGAISSWSVLQQPSVAWVIWVTAAAGLIAGVFPSVREALDLDLHVDEISRIAAQFKNLQDRFRIAADTGPFKPPETFEAEVRDLMERLDEARKASVTPPERCFKKAQAKIKAGDYSFSVDADAK
jgi:hypothetical protein